MSAVKFLLSTFESTYRTPECENAQTAQAASDLTLNTCTDAPGPGEVNICGRLVGTLKMSIDPLIFDKIGIECIHCIDFEIDRTSIPSRYQHYLDKIHTYRTPECENAHTVEVDKGVTLKTFKSVHGYSFGEVNKCGRLQSLKGGCYREKSILDQQREILSNHLERLKDALKGFFSFRLGELNGVFCINGAYNTDPWSTKVSSMVPTLTYWRGKCDNFDVWRTKVTSMEKCIHCTDIAIDSTSIPSRYQQYLDKIHTFRTPECENEHTVEVDKGVKMKTCKSVHVVPVTFHIRGCFNVKQSLKGRCYREKSILDQQREILSNHLERLKDALKGFFSFRLGELNGVLCINGAYNTDPWSTKVSSMVPTLTYWRVVPVTFHIRGCFNVKQSLKGGCYRKKSNHLERLNDTLKGYFSFKLGELNGVLCINGANNTDPWRRNVTMRHNYNWMDDIFVCAIFPLFFIYII
ncbi:unnamed protein product [Mytilus coruscus]|uniref:Uncharacterized protein n=1 Tax=Mytilus coruscus TaxID=42192 RepID=A0A6J8D717_MYTCO|nr:unnamed protein product [Mytilus coruscus]